MPRPEKVQVVEEIKARLESTPVVFFTEYRGLSVSEQQSLRRNLRETDTEYKVIKISLARRAVDELGLDQLAGLLSGPTALAFTAGDPVPAAKALRDFGRDHLQLLIKGAWLRGQLLAPEKVEELADLEPREVILAKIAGAMGAPMSNLAGLMAAFTRNAATLISQLLEKREEAEGAAPAPAEEAPEEEALAEEETAAEAEAAQAAEPEVAAESVEEPAETAEATQETEENEQEETEEE